MPPFQPWALLPETVQLPHPKHKIGFFVPVPHFPLFIWGFLFGLIPRLWREFMEGISRSGAT